MGYKIHAERERLVDRSSLSAETEDVIFQVKKNGDCIGIKLCREEKRCFGRILYGVLQAALIR